MPPRSPTLKVSQDKRRSTFCLFCRRRAPLAGGQRDGRKRNLSTGARALVERPLHRRVRRRRVDRLYGNGASKQSVRRGSRVCLGQRSQHLRGARELVVDQNLQKLQSAFVKLLC